MNVTNKIHAKFTKIFEKLKSLGIIQTFKLEINFCRAEGNLSKSFLEIDAILKRCLRKILNKPRRAEIRNIISELVRKKNLNDINITNQLVNNNLPSSKSYLIPLTNDFIGDIALKHQCDSCQETFELENDLICHQKHHERSEHLCEKCGKLFYNIKEWKEHEKVFNDESFELIKEAIEILNNGNSGLNLVPEALAKNKKISENFTESSEFELELENIIEKSHSENSVVEKKAYICICGKNFQLLKALRKHEKLKHSLKNVKHHCNTCGKTFTEKGKLNRHLLSHKECQFKCSSCSKLFSRSDTLKRHISLFHFSGKEFFCNFCNKKFSLKYNRDVHEENIHKNLNDRIQCEHCEKKFKNKITLKSHLKTHSENRITCSMCCKSFTRNSYFKIHVRNKHFGMMPSENTLDSVT